MDVPKIYEYVSPDYLKEFFRKDITIVNNEIPFKYYAKFWLKYSLEASATGAVLGLIVRSGFMLICVSGLGFIIGQVVIYRYFNGNRRGKFAFDYRDSLIKSEIRKVLINQLGWLTYIHRFLWGEAGEYNWYGNEIFSSYDRILNDNADGDERFKFLINLHAGKIAKKRALYSKAITYLNKSVEIKPNDLVSYFILGECYEKQDAVEKAINAYKAGIQDSETVSPYLKDYVLSQIERIKTQGPKKRPPIPGLRHGN